MRQTESLQVLNLQTTEGIDIQIIPDNMHEFLMTTKEVAIGYNVSESTIRKHIKRHSDELLEESHFLFDRETNSPSKSKYFKRLFWTKSGVIKLGFFIKSEPAKQFRSWAEKLILNELEKSSEKETRYIAINREKALELLINVQDSDTRRGLFHVMKEGGLV